MGKIDIVIWVILIFMATLGFFKGFFKQILSTANWLVSLIVAFVFVKPFSNLMMKTALSTNINQKVVNWIASKGEIFQIPYDPANANSQLSDAISNGLKLPKFIAEIIAKGIKIDIPEGTTLAEIIAPAISSIIITVISFIALFIFSYLVLKLIISILNLVFDSGILGFINRLLGASLGLVKGILFISIVMLLLSTLSSVIPALNEFLINDLKLNEETFSIGKFFYENNLLIELLKGSFSFDNILSNLKSILEI